MRSCAAHVPTTRANHKTNLVSRIDIDLDLFAGQSLDADLHFCLYTICCAEEVGARVARARKVRTFAGIEFNGAKKKSKQTDTQP